MRMSGDMVRRTPPFATRFRKGQSGNPKGRPKASPSVPPSAFDVIVDRTLTVTQNGTTREVTIEEALQHRTYQDAIAGSRAAQREVLKMIAKREKWLAAKKGTQRSSVRALLEPDPENADDGLLLLGIAAADNINVPDGCRRLLLQPWAVQRALSRGRRPLTARDTLEIACCTRDAPTLRWPAGAKHEHDE
jgi:hypothetical protein